MGRDRNQADIRFAGRQFYRATGGSCVTDLVAQTPFTALGLVLEVPHERSRIEEVDGRHSNAALHVAGH
jgi:hypothetical protein